MVAYGPWVQPPDEQVAVIPPLQARIWVPSAPEPRTTWGQVTGTLVLSETRDLTISHTLSVAVARNDTDAAGVKYAGSLFVLTVPIISTPEPRGVVEPDSIPAGAVVEYESDTSVYVGDPRLDLQFPMTVSVSVPDPLDPAAGAPTSVSVRQGPAGFTGAPSPGVLSGWSTVASFTVQPARVSDHVYQATVQGSASIPFTWGAAGPTFVVAPDWWASASMPQPGPYVPGNSTLPQYVSSVSPSLRWAAIATSRPPRYRFVYAQTGMWRLRQRQSAGAADGWSLRHRQNSNMSGSWPLRQRQDET